MNKKILFIINVDWFFISHFLPVGQKMIEKGYEVHIACALTDNKAFLEKEGFIVHDLFLSRSNTVFLSEIKTIFQIFNILKVIKPNILECLTIKPVLYAGLLSRFFRYEKKVFYITGLGYVFIKKGLKGAIVRYIVKFIYKLAIKGVSSRVITENIFDMKLIADLGVVGKDQINVLRGAGVDLEKYTYRVENFFPVRVTMACRLLRDKGVLEYVQAAQILKEREINVVFNLYGDIDIHNPASLTVEELSVIRETSPVVVSGFTNDIADVFANSSIVVLPSYREGLPKVLVEAAACGRAIVTSDVPGCRDAIEVGVTGLLCNVKDADSLAESIEKLILDKNLRDKMGRAGRFLAQKEFDIKHIVNKHVSIFEEKKA